VDLQLRRPAGRLGSTSTRVRLSGYAEGYPNKAGSRSTAARNGRSEQLFDLSSPPEFSSTSPTDTPVVMRRWFVSRHYVLSLEYLAERPSRSSIVPSRSAFKRNYGRLYESCLAISALSKSPAGEGFGVGRRGVLLFEKSRSPIPAPKGLRRQEASATRYRVQARVARRGSQERSDGPWRPRRCSSSN